MQPQSKRPGTGACAGRGLDHGPAPASRQTPPPQPAQPHSRTAAWPPPLEAALSWAAAWAGPGGTWRWPRLYLLGF